MTESAGYLPAHSHAQVQLDQWSQLKAPLSEAEKESVTALQDQIDSVHHPVQHASSSFHQAVANVTRSDLLAEPAVLPFPSSGMDRPTLLHLPSVPLDSAPAFLSWFDTLSASMAHATESAHLEALNRIKTAGDQTDGLLTDIETCEVAVREMRAGWAFVEESSRSLQEEAEGLLEQQNHLLSLHDGISTRLEYFAELERATRLLNQSGTARLVLSDDFLGTLDRLDVCAAFARAHPHYRDAQLFALRFDQCITRAMTLVKMYTVGIFRNLQAEIAAKVRNQDLSDLETRLLLYDKFSSSAPPLRALLAELEKRASPSSFGEYSGSDESLLNGTSNAAEFASLLSECRAAWFGARRPLLVGLLGNKVQLLEASASAQGQIVQLARDGCELLRRLCADEYALYAEFFSKSINEPDLYEYLETLCHCVNDYLRPRIMREPKLEVLSSLCGVLQKAMHGWDDTAPLGDGAQVTERSSSGTQQPFAFAPLLRSVVQEVQTRLIFRAQAFIVSDIQRHNATPEDLDYPSNLGISNSNEDKGAKPSECEPNGQDARKQLRGASSIGGAGVLGAAELDEQGGVRLFQAPPEGVLRTWYPTLRKTLWVLEKLYTHIDQAIFIDLAQEAVTACRTTLISASEQMLRGAAKSRVDALLFLIRHLLILRETVASVDLSSKDRAVDFSVVREALHALWRNTSAILDPRALYGIASKGLPRVIESSIDAKIDLDHELQRASGELTSHVAQDVALPLRIITDQAAKAFDQSTARDGAGAAVAEWQQPGRVCEAFAAFRTCSQVNLPEAVQAIRAYLEDEKAVRSLVGPTVDRIVEAFESFRNLVKSGPGRENDAFASELPLPGNLRLQLLEQSGITDKANAP